MVSRLSLVTVCAALLVAPAIEGLAQEDDGRSLMERGAELFLEGLRKEMEPALGDLRDLAQQFGPSMQSFLQEMGPALADLMDEVSDWSVYEAPEILPNGDIIIRRKPDPDRDAVPEDGQNDNPPEPTDI